MIRVEIPTCRMSCFADGGLYRSRIACVLGVGMLLFLLFLSTSSAPHALAPLKHVERSNVPQRDEKNCLTADPVQKSKCRWEGRTKDDEHRSTRKPTPISVEAERSI
jgi:hypothetical protein